MKYNKPMTDITNNLPLGHDPEQVKRDGMIFCRAFAAFVYAKGKCANCPNNKTAAERQTNG